MRNVRCYPFQQFTYDPYTQRQKSPTYYNDIVTHYTIHYGITDKFFQDDIVVGVQFEPSDNEHDIINFMDIVMGNPRVRAIVVDDTAIDKNLSDYAIRSNIDCKYPRPDFVYMKENVYHNRTCYVRPPESCKLYDDMKEHIWKAFEQRIKWNNSELLVIQDESQLHSQEAHIDVKFDDAHQLCCVFFKNPDKFIEREIKIRINTHGSLDISDSENRVDPKRGIEYDEDSWLTKVQRFFIGDLNKFIQYRKL